MDHRGSFLTGRVRGADRGGRRGRCSLTAEDPRGLNPTDPCSQPGGAAGTVAEGDRGPGRDPAPRRARRSRRSLSRSPLRLAHVKGRTMQPARGPAERTGRVRAGTATQPAVAAVLNRRGRDACCGEAPSWLRWDRGELSAWTPRDARPACRRAERWRRGLPAGRLCDERARPPTRVSRRATDRRRGVLPALARGPGSGRAGGGDAALAAWSWALDLSAEER